MSRRPKGKRKQRKDLLGSLLLAGAAALLASGLALGYVLRPPALDRESLCRLDEPPPAVTLVLIESSDVLQPRHKRRLRAAIEEEAFRLPKHGRLLLLGMRPDDPREPKALFSRCNPGDGRSANPLFANPARVQARFESAFLEPLKAAANRAAASRREAKASPIVEALRAASLEPDFARPGARRRLMLVSDLLEHDPEAGFSAYADGADLALYQARFPGATPPALADVEVRVVVLDREGLAARQAAARDQLWTPLFDASETKSLGFDGL